jgi:poly-gamma-glutamate capsule biosynthesis protein CapA/YwtB (metallophosphatase superfamily)
MNIAVVKPNLKHYIDNNNHCYSLLNDKFLGRHLNEASKLTKEEIEYIRKDVEAALEPDNITCDGERSLTEQKQAKAYLMAVLRELPA